MERLERKEGKWREREPQRDRSKEGRDGWRETDEASGHARPAHPSVIENESVREAS